MAMGTLCTSTSISLGLAAVTAEVSVERQRRMRMSSGPSQIPSLRNVRTDLLLALASQAAFSSQRAIESVVTETSKYLNPRREEPRNLEEALMTVPDLETIPYRVVRREKSYDIREVESYLIAETDLPGRTGFDFISSGQGFNTLADYLFGKNKGREAMEMTTPVVVHKVESQGEKMAMTTPVISQKGSDSRGTWRMAFVLPSKYTEDNVPVPENSTVKLRRVPPKTMAVTAFSGYVTDELIKRKEQKLRRALEQDGVVRVKDSAQPEVAQYNPPFTPPFARRNEVALEVEYVRSAGY